MYQCIVKTTAYDHTEDIHIVYHNHDISLTDAYIHSY